MTSTATTGFTWDSLVKKFEEAEALQGEYATDIQEIESGNTAEIIEGWENLSTNDAQNPIWADLLNDPNSTASAKNGKLISDAESYMQSITVEVGQPNQPGNYINLYVGTNGGSDGDGGIIQNFQDVDQDGDPIPATLYEVLVQDPNASLINNYSDAYENLGPYGGESWQQGLDGNGQGGQGNSAPWAYDGNLSFQISDQDDYNGQYVAAQGTLAQWGSNIVFSGGDPSQMNKDLQA